MHTMKSKDIPNPEQPKSQSDFWKNKKHVELSDEKRKHTRKGRI